MHTLLTLACFRLCHPYPITSFVWAGPSTGLMTPSLIGTPVQTLMHGVDWLPTFCAVAGLTDCGDHGLKLDGVDVSGPIFKNSSGGHDYVLYGQHDDAPNSFKPFDDAIRDADGWKLIQGTGGKPATWSQPVNFTTATTTATATATATAACTTSNCVADPLYNPFGLAPADMKLPSPDAVVCSSNASWQPHCYPNNDLSWTTATSAGDCCAACSKQLGCGGWTFNTQSGRAQNCYLKKSMGKPNSYSGCISGGAAPPTPTMPPTPRKPTPAPPPANGVLLFNVMTDPGEHNDVSKENPDIVARLGKVLNAMRATAVQANDNLTCAKDGGKRTTPNGTYVIPYCNVTAAPRPVMASSA